MEILFYVITTVYLIILPRDELGDEVVALHGLRDVPEEVIIKMVHRED